MIAKETVFLSLVFCLLGDHGWIPARKDRNTAPCKDSPEPATLTPRYLIHPVKQCGELTRQRMDWLSRQGFEI